MRDRNVPPWVFLSVLRMVSTRYEWKHHDGLGLYAILPDCSQLAVCPITAFAMCWTGSAFYHEAPFSLSARHLAAAQAVGMSEAETQEWVAATLGQGRAATVAALHRACRVRPAWMNLECLYDKICAARVTVARHLYPQKFDKRKRP